jgi:hypothetical protein
MSHQLIDAVSIIEKAQKYLIEIEIVILSEASRSLIARGVVEGPAVYS